MPEWRAYPSRITTGINRLPDTFIEGRESLGSPSDARATGPNNSTHSMFALLKGIAAGLHVPAGSGDGNTNVSAKIFPDPTQTLGEPADAPAVSASDPQSAISLMKGILVSAGL